MYSFISHIYKPYIRKLPRTEILHVIHEGLPEIISAFPINAKLLRNAYQYLPISNAFIAHTKHIFCISTFILQYIYCVF